MNKFLLIVGLLIFSVQPIFSQKLKGKKLLKEAKVLLDQGKEREAISVLRVNFNVEDKSVVLISKELAELYVNIKFLDSANYFLSISERQNNDKIQAEIAALQSVVKANTEIYKIEVLSGWKAFDQEDYLSADEHFSKALEYDLGNYEAYLGKAEILAIGGQNKEALKGFNESLIKYFPNLSEKAHIYEHIAEVHLVDRNTLLALDACNMGLELDPENKGLHFYKGKSFYLQRLFDEANVELIKYLRLDPSKPEAWYYSGECYYELEEYSKAVSSLVKSIDLDTTNIDAYNLRGRAYYMIEDYQNAKSDFVKLNSVHIENFYAINAIGLCEYQLKNYAKAVAQFEKSTELNPSVYYYYNLMQAYVANNQNKEAVALGEELAKKYRANPKFNIVHCQALINLGKYQEAKEWLEGSMAYNQYIERYVKLGVEINKELGNVPQSKDLESRLSNYVSDPLNMELKF